MSCSVETLKYWLTYDPVTGFFVWNHSSAPTVPKGSVAGSLNKNGYWCIKLQGKLYNGSRLAWLYMTGNWPKRVVDHKNRIKSDNRWDNLRDVTQLTNTRNRSVAQKNKSGRVGVNWYKATGKWQSQIKIPGKKINLGYFTKLEDAIAARELAERQYFKE